MAKSKYNYNLFNMVTNKFELKNVSLAEICKVTGMATDTAFKYAERGYTHDSRYHITRHLIGYSDEVDREEKTIVPRELQAKWDDVMGAFKLLQNGGRIVYRYGKPHHVEAVKNV